jgi:hypothetical protein
MAKEKFQVLSDKWLLLQGKVRKECIKFLEKTLKANNNHLEWDDSELDGSVCVTYDGGNHPEYASNAFSTVTGIDLNERGEITLDIEDDSEYDIENITTEELYDICDFVDNVLLPEE